MRVVLIGMGSGFIDPSCDVERMAANGWRTDKRIAACADASTGSVWAGWSDGGQQSRLEQLTPPARARLSRKGLVARAGASTSSAPWAVMRWRTRQSTGVLIAAPATMAWPFSIRLAEPLAPQCYDDERQNKD